MKKRQIEPSFGRKEGSPLPWGGEKQPLMLAPMQGLTHSALRSFFIERVRPDVVFTEFMRVSPVARKRLSAGALREAQPEQQGVPLVVQLIGHGAEALATAAVNAQKSGAFHVNLNLGCPYGRMTTSPTGGHLLRYPERLRDILAALRSVIRGSFSVKVRSGFSNPDTIFELLPLLERTGVDFLILHPRTVQQEYTGEADHRLTAEVVRRSSLPVIANGDIRDAETGLRVLDQTGAAGLMLGRGAIADPWLFERLRGTVPKVTTREERRELARHYLEALLCRCEKRYCGEIQALAKVKAVVVIMEQNNPEIDLKPLRRARTVDQFRIRLQKMGGM